MLQYQDFKSVYHLVGGQTIPIFLSAIQFSVKAHHYFLVTEKTEQAAADIIKTLKSRNIQAEICNLGPESVAIDFQCLEKKFTELFSSLPQGSVQNSCLDVTGGTKPMAIIATRLAEKMGIRTFYIDTPQKKSLWFTNNLELPLTEKIKLSEFPKLVGFQIQKGKKNALFPSDGFLKFLYEQRENILRVSGEEPFKRLKKLNKEKLKDFLKALKGKNAAQWNGQLQDPFYSGLQAEAQGKFLTGGWFEYYTYNVLKKQLQKSGVTEMVMNMTLQKEGQAEQEFDIVYTDGYSFFIVECKSGTPKQEAFQKLENLRNSFSGVLGRAVLVTGNSIRNKKSFKIRIESRREISAFCGKSGIEQLGAKMLGFAPGKIFGD